MTQTRLILAVLEDRAVPSAGSLDPAFGTGGLVTTDFRYDDRASAVVVQPDGKIVVGGSIENRQTHLRDFALARYNPDGSLDTTFGNGGLVTTNLGGDDAARDVALQGDGKIVVAGESDGSFALARYNRDGSFDRSFGTKGKVFTDFGPGRDAAFGVAIQSDGRIVAAGFTVTGSSADFALARYTSSGQLDTTFDGDGKVTTDFRYSGGELGAAVALYPDSDPVHRGKIVVAGTAFGIDDAGNPADFAVARYTTSGALDTTFDGDGKATLDFHPFGGDAGTDDRADDVAVQPDGKVVIVGWVPLWSSFGVARLTPEGQPDPTFGIAGRVTTDEPGFSLFASSVALQADGKIVVAGTAKPEDTPGIPDSDFALVRYTPVGLLDPTFGSNGKVFTNFGSSEDSAAADVTIQPADGKIVAVGWTKNPSQPTVDFAVARYLGDDAPAGLAAQALTGGDGAPTAAAFTLSPATTPSAAAPADGTLTFNPGEGFILALSGARNADGDDRQDRGTIRNDREAVLPATPPALPSTPTLPHDLPPVAPEEESENLDPLLTDAILANALQRDWLDHED